MKEENINNYFKPREPEGYIKDTTVSPHPIFYGSTDNGLCIEPVEYKNNVDKQYNELFQKILDEGEWSDNRTGVRTKSIFGENIKMDMREGFPIFTSRQMPFKSFTGELECFLQGYTSKIEFKERGCNWWQSWCNPMRVTYGNDPETKLKMQKEDDLGLIYGAQIRNFSDPKHIEFLPDPFDGSPTIETPVRGIDQLQVMIDKIRNGIDDRRLIVSMWNPLAFERMALVPCHYAFQVYLSPCGSYLDLMWNQRSVDLALGANNTLYGILIHLLAYESGRIPRYLTACYGNVHIYEDQIDIVKEQLTRPTHKLPTLKIKEWKFDDIYNWTHDCVELVGYQHSGVLKYPQATV